MPKDKMPCGLTGYNQTAGEMCALMIQLAEEGKFHILREYLNKAEAEGCLMRWEGIVLE